MMSRSEAAKKAWETIRQRRAQGFYKKQKQKFYTDEKKRIRPITAPKSQLLLPSPITRRIHEARIREMIMASGMRSRLLSERVENGKLMQSVYFYDPYWNRTLAVERQKALAQEYSRRTGMTIERVGEWKPNELIFIFSRIAPELDEKYRRLEASIGHYGGTWIKVHRLYYEDFARLFGASFPRTFRYHEDKDYYEVYFADKTKAESRLKAMDGKEYKLIFREYENGHKQELELRDVRQILEAESKCVCGAIIPAGARHCERCQRPIPTKPFPIGVIKQIYYKKDTSSPYKNMGVDRISLKADRRNLFDLVRNKADWKVHTSPIKVKTIEEAEKLADAIRYYHGGAQITDVGNGFVVTSTGLNITFGRWFRQKLDKTAKKI